jgi:hypothetical protein
MSKLKNAYKNIDFWGGGIVGIFFVIIGFELRASYLLGRSSISPSCFRYFLSTLIFLPMTSYIASMTGMNHHLLVEMGVSLTFAWASLEP